IRAHCRWDGGRMSPSWNWMVREKIGSSSSRSGPTRFRFLRTARLTEAVRWWFRALWQAAEPKTERHPVGKRTGEQQFWGVRRRGTSGRAGADDSEPFD